jgi:3-hydroxybutyrate dehydrogenase
MQLENKVAIVTGAASGIGKGIAALFARKGAKVVIADLNKKDAEAVAAEFGGAKRALGIAVDVTNEAETADCVAKTVDAFGRLDILVSNAGIQTVAPIDQFDFAKWRQLLAIHLDGAFLTHARGTARNE